MATFEDIYFSRDFADWIMENARDRGYVVCNGDTMIEAMDALFEDYCNEKNIDLDE